MPSQRQDNLRNDTRSMTKNKAILLLLIIYTVGIVGITIPATRALTLSLTPVNLLVSLFILIALHKKLTFNSFIGLVVVASLGFFIEVLGVKTQVLFGAYTYGDTLGFHVFAVPLAMGINWFILIYTTRILAQKISKNIIVIALVSALLMVGFDFILEPVAQFMDMWQWKRNVIPMQNYLAWFVASFFIQLLYCNIEKKIQNPIAIYVLCIQIVFFGLLRAYIYFL